MSFYERYISICQAHGIEPCSQSTADLFHITKATISSWGTKNTSPKGETVRAIAAALHTSTDYLLGLTDNPESRKDADAAPEKSADAVKLMEQYIKLDTTDRIKLAAYLDGLLSADKYSQDSSLQGAKAI